MKKVAKMLLKAYQSKDWTFVAKGYESMTGKAMPVPVKFTIDYDWRESDNNKAVKEG